MQRWHSLCEVGVAAAVLLVAACVPAQAVSMYQPGLGSILKASRPLMLNTSAYAPGPAPDAQAEGAPLSVYSTSASAVAACLPLSVKFYDAQRSGRVLPRVPWRLPSEACPACGSLIPGVTGRTGIGK